MDEARARGFSPTTSSWPSWLRSPVSVAASPARAGRYEIGNVPAAIRARSIGPVATRYDRVTFDLERRRGRTCARRLLAPGHPLHDAVMDETVRTLAAPSPTARSGVGDGGGAHLLVGVLEEVVDATGEPVARRFGYAFVDQLRAVSPPGRLPIWTASQRPTRRRWPGPEPWGGSAMRRQATSWIIAHQLPEYMAEVQPRRAAELAKIRTLVTARLDGETERLLLDAAVAAEQERAGAKPKESSESLNRKAVELDPMPCLARRSLPG